MIQDASTQQKILLLEDDLSLVQGLSFAFKKQGFAIGCRKNDCGGRYILGKGGI